MPESLTTLEWHNRRDGAFNDLRPKLKRLPKLEYLQMGHADFTMDDFTKFLEIVNVSNLPKLQYLVRFLRKRIKLFELQMTFRCSDSVSSRWKRRGTCFCETDLISLRRLSDCSFSS